MKKTLFALASLAAILTLPSCFQHETTVHLNKDGSGTIVQDTKFGAQMIAMIAQMAAMGGDEKAKNEDPLKAMLSEEKAKARAADLGEGVTFVKVEPSEANGAKGSKATYAFKDINKIKLSAGDGMKALEDIPGAKPAEKPKEEPMTFQFADGKLSVNLPQPKKDDAAAEKKEEAKEGQPNLDDPQAMAMMKQVMGDMKVGIKLVIEPGIAESNATHKDGNTITLMEMDMGKIVENADAMKKLMKMGDEKDPKVAMEALKGVDGIKVETQEKITVSMK
jgi:hypothetical protein